MLWISTNYLVVHNRSFNENWSVGFLICPRCGKDEAYFIGFDLIEGRNPLLTLLMCPCGMRKFGELEFEIFGKDLHFFYFDLEFPFFHHIVIRRNPELLKRCVPIL